MVAEPKPLAQRRERRRDDQHVLLLDEPTAGGRGPAAVLARFITNPGALVRVLVGPDVDPLVQRAEFGMTGGRQWRQLDPSLDPLSPPLDDLLSDARQHRIGADLIKTAVLPRCKGRAEWRRIDDLARHLDDEFLDLGRPVRDRLRTNPRPMLRIVIGPDVDNVIEGPDFGMKERAERRRLDALGQ